MSTETSSSYYERFNSSPLKDISSRPDFAGSINLHSFSDEMNSECGSGKLITYDDEEFLDQPIPDVHIQSY
jgi:hypothetical protein